MFPDVRNSEADQNHRDDSDRQVGGEEWGSEESRLVLTINRYYRAVLALTGREGAETELFSNIEGNGGKNQICTDPQLYLRERAGAAAVHVRAQLAQSVEALSAEALPRGFEPQVRRKSRPKTTPQTASPSDTHDVEAL